MRKIMVILVLISLLVVNFYGCKPKEDNMENETMKSYPKIVINLEDGRKIRLELYPDIAPVTVDNFLNLVDEGYYTNTVFHRIIAKFMIQAGLLELDNAQLKEKPEKDTIVGEFSQNGHTGNTLSHTIGVISMARTSVMDSASSQFFICSDDSSHLDGQYAAFGKTLDEESNSVVLSLSYYPTGNFHHFEDFPVTTDGKYVIISSIERMN